MSDFADREATPAAVLGKPEADVLRALADGEPRRLPAIAAATGRTPFRVSQIMNRLTALGYVQAVAPGARWQATAAGIAVAGGPGCAGEFSAV